ncbi:DUF4347 domain-containing protein, partial [Desulforhopalus vacuolatus]|uniref:DUF4347 domain-containing protein n=2 Tax=Desulforhopalus vacuolatus TaxID=40414 RepID=UPI001963D539
MSTLIIVDDKVENYESLLPGLPEDAEVLFIDSTHNGVEQIADYLEDREGYDALHVISHGSSGNLYLGRDVVDIESMQAQKDVWIKIGQSLNETGDIFLYGCNVAEGEKGETFIQQLAEFSSADVAASTNSTGSGLPENDWVLEASTGSIETSDSLNILETSWQGSLSWYNTLASVSLSTLITDALADSIFNFQEVFNLLETAVEDGITAFEFSDLQTFYDNSISLFSNDYVRYITDAVINGNPANATWWGGTSSTDTIGNLSAGSSEYVGESLIDEWFEGLDLPGTAYSYGTATGDLFVDGVAASDVNQGSLGDCYFVTSMGAIAESQPQYIYEAFTENYNGIYGVRFFYEGEPIYTTVNASIPINGSGVVFCGNDSDELSGESWTSLMEKAFVQVQDQLQNDRVNDYSTISSGTSYAISQITNLEQSASYKFTADSDPVWENEAEDSLIEALDAGSIVYFASEQTTTDDNGLTLFKDSHAFMVLGYNLDDNDQVTFTIRNPWGEASSDMNARAKFQASIEDFSNGIGGTNSDGTVADPYSIVRIFDVAPTLSSLTPTDNATDVEVNSNITLTFSEAVQAGTGNILIYNDNGTLAQNIAVTDDQVTFSNDTVTINPTDDLSSDSSYYVNLAAGVITDMSGNDFAGISGSDTYNFTTSEGYDIINGTTVSGGDAGDSRTGATAVSLDSNGDASITGYAGDNDYYKFVAQSSGTATISLTGLSSNIDLDLRESPDENSANPIGLLAVSHLSGSSSESVSYNLTSGETYYVNVDPDGTSTSDYNLSINTVAAVTPVPSTNNDIINGEIVSGGDAGDSRTGAAAVSLDSNGDASITGYAGENDFYTFVAQHPGTATIDLTGLSSDIDLRLLSSSGSRLDSSSSHSSYSGGSSSESISYNLTSGEIYYVKVDPYKSNTSDYNLSINTVAAVNDIVNGTTISGGDAGNSRTGATAVSLDSNGDTSITGYAGENDFYTFVAQHP